MQSHLTALRNFPIFSNMTDMEILDIKESLSWFEKSYKKDDLILQSQAETKRIGIIIAGSVTIESNDLWGNRTILSHVDTGNIFAETYAISKSPLLVDVSANEDCHILFLEINIPLLLTINKFWSTKLIENLLNILANKNLHLSERSFHTSPKTIRQRLMSYLNSLSIKHKTNAFSIPFDRQQLADYLNLDRSALSKELGKMQREGIISVKKNYFTIHVT